MINIKVWSLLKIEIDKKSNYHSWFIITNFIVATTNLSGIAKILSMKNKLKDQFYSRSKRTNNHQRSYNIKSVSPTPDTKIIWSDEVSLLMIV